MRLARIPTAAKEFNVSKQFLWSLVRDKKINAVVIDGVHYIDLDTITYTPKHDYKGGGRPKRKENE